MQACLWNPLQTDRQTQYPNTHTHTDAMRMIEDDSERCLSERVWGSAERCFSKRVWGSPASVRGFEDDSANPVLVCKEQSRHTPTDAHSDTAFKWACQCANASVPCQCSNASVPCQCANASVPCQCANASVPCQCSNASVPCQCWPVKKRALQDYFNDSFTYSHITQHGTTSMIASLTHTHTRNPQTLTLGLYMHWIPGWVCVHTHTHSYV